MFNEQREKNYAQFDVTMPQNLMPQNHNCQTRKPFKSAKKNYVITENLMNTGFVTVCRNVICHTDTKEMINNAAKVILYNS